MNWFLWSVAIAVTCISEGARLRSLDYILENDSDSGELWAVLVAGSNGWYNYRHQADVCHAYQILHQHGVPDDHIITMMYDDISNNSRNPNPGVIINRPNGPNVYKGVPKDYTGKDVTPGNFLHILQGNAKAMEGIGSGKVINSTDKDRIFINLVDHGGPVFCFPEHVLHAKKFWPESSGKGNRNRAETVTTVNEPTYPGVETSETAWWKMPAGRYMPNNDRQASMLTKKFSLSLNDQNTRKKSQFSKTQNKSTLSIILVNLSDKLKKRGVIVYGLSASSPLESSWATYCDILNGVCLGDEFSVNWMHDTEANDPTTETLKTQFENTKRLTKGSRVMQWGDTSIDVQVVATFFGPTSSAPKNYSTIHTQETSIPVHEVPLVMLERELKSATNEFEKKTKAKEITALIQRRAFVHTTMKNIALVVTGDEKLTEEMMVRKDTHITNWSCYNPVVHAFSENCFNLGQSTYALTTVHTLLHLCEAGYSRSDIINSMNIVCTFLTIENAI
ncbi:legumain-like [Macrobrachium rosenbergii]|uniref:legumain-like n=1 Tax=Macrobrachium rosenbergii TaxID=79674 RepID=UPI0034D4E8C8